MFLRSRSRSKLPALSLPPPSLYLAQTSLYPKHLCCLPPPSSPTFRTSLGTQLSGWRRIYSLSPRVSPRADCDRTGQRFLIPQPSPFFPRRPLRLLRRKWITIKATTAGRRRLLRPLPCQLPSGPARQRRSPLAETHSATASSRRPPTGRAVPIHSFSPLRRARPAASARRRPLVAATTTGRGGTSIPGGSGKTRWEKPWTKNVDPKGEMAGDHPARDRHIHWPGHLRLPDLGRHPK